MMWVARYDIRLRECAECGQRLRDAWIKGLMTP
jgi:hypothetical protein